MSARSQGASEISKPALQDHIIKTGPLKALGMRLRCILLPFQKNVFVNMAKKRKMAISLSSVSGCHGDPSGAELGRWLE